LWHKKVVILTLSEAEGEEPAYFVFALAVAVASEIGQGLQPKPHPRLKMGLQPRDILPTITVILSEGWRAFAPTAAQEPVLSAVEGACHQAHAPPHRNLP
jgi:hypothetical protein